MSTIQERKKKSESRGEFKRSQRFENPDIAERFTRDTAGVERAVNTKRRGEATTHSLPLRRERLQVALFHRDIGE
jgi:hypothetical protein